MDNARPGSRHAYLDGTKLLSPEAERALVRRYKETQDPHAEAQLVSAYLRLVVRMAQLLRVPTDDYEDLLQEGNLGLIQAVRRYDPELGKLSTYAAWWIRAYQLRFLMANHRLVRIGTSQNQRKIFFRLSRTRSRLEAAGQPVDDAAVARALGVPTQEVSDMAARMAGREASIDQPVRGHEKRALGEDLVDQGPDPEVRYGAAEERAILARTTAEMRRELRGRDRALLDRYHQDPTPSLQEMGRRFGVSRERARQLDTRLVDRLRRRMNVRPQVFA